MEILIAGGTGFIGQALVKYLLESIKSYNITILSRSKAKPHRLFRRYNTNNINYLTWQELEYSEENLVNIISKYDVIINLSGYNIGQKRWTKRVKNKILASRTEPTKLLAKACALVQNQKNKSIALYNASAIGIYGLTDESKVYTEDSFVYKSTDFVSQVGLAWERSAEEALANNVRVVFMRFAVVLDSKGGALKKMLLPFKLGLGGKIGSGNQPFCWVALKDLVRIIEVLINDKKVHGPINLVAPELCTQQEFANKLAKSLNKPCFMPMPAFIIKLLFGQMGQELLLTGQRVKSYKLNVYYHNWQYPNISKFFGAC